MAYLFYISVTGNYFGGAPAMLVSHVSALSYNHGVSRRQQLKYVRHTRSFLEKAALQADRLAEQADVLDWPEDAKRYRQEAEMFRADLQRFKNEERELWEQQPGRIAAPPPRENK